LIRIRLSPPIIASDSEPPIHVREPREDIPGKLESPLKLCGNERDQNPSDDMRSLGRHRQHWGGDALTIVRARIVQPFGNPLDHFNGGYGVAII
jgi:hypothetical protein